MGAFGQIVGGLLEGVGTGLTENVKAMREEAQKQAERDARTADLKMSADLNDRNAARNDDRGFKNRLGEIDAQGAQTQKNATFENGLLLQRGAVENGYQSARQQAGFAHDDASKLRDQAHADARAEAERNDIHSVETGADGNLYTVSKAGKVASTGIKAKPKVGEDGYTPGETRMVKATLTNHTTKDEDGVSVVDKVAVANQLGEAGRPDLAADYDPRWRPAADTMARTGKAPGYDRAAAGRNAGRPSDPLAPAVSSGKPVTISNTPAPGPKRLRYNPQTGQIE